jgi:hypothetical protein
MAVIRIGFRPPRILHIPHGRSKQRPTIRQVDTSMPEGTEAKHANNFLFSFFLTFYLTSLYAYSL